MKNFTYEGKSMNQLYTSVCADLVHDPDFVVGPRGLKTRELLNARLVLTEPHRCITTLAGRNIDMHYLVGEFVYYLAKRTDFESINFYSSFWSRGHADGEKTNSHYGYRLFGRNYKEPSIDNKISQFGYAYNQLVRDKNTRKAVAFISGPEDLDLNTKDNICTTALQFIIRNDQLHLYTNMRSNDVWYGLTYNVAFFCLVQEIMLNMLQLKYPRLEMGEYVHDARSLHVYEKHFGLLKKISPGELSESISEYIPGLERTDTLYWFNEIIAWEESYRENNAIPKYYKGDRVMTPFEEWCVGWLKEGKK